MLLLHLRKSMIEMSVLRENDPNWKTWTGNLNYWKEAAGKPPLNIITTEV